MGHGEGDRVANNIDLTARKALRWARKEIVCGHFLQLWDEWSLSYCFFFFFFGCIKKGSAKSIKMLIRTRKKNIVFTFNLAGLLIDDRKQPGNQSRESIFVSCDSFVSRNTNCTPPHLPPSYHLQSYTSQTCQRSYCKSYFSKTISFQCYISTNQATTGATEDRLRVIMPTQHLRITDDTAKYFWLGDWTWDLIIW